MLEVTENESLNKGVHHEKKSPYQNKYPERMWESTFSQGNLLIRKRRRSYGIENF